MSRAKAPPQPLLDLLERIVVDIPICTIDEIWVFPIRRVRQAESAVVVVSALPIDPDRRRVFTGHYSLRPGELQESIREFAVVPADRVGPVIDGVLRRLDDGVATAAEPRTARIHGDPLAWTALVRAVAVTEYPSSRARLAFP